MRLPAADRARVDKVKVCGYLLNAAYGRRTGKDALFEAFGFTIEDWPIFATALRRHAIDNEVIETRRSEHGLKFIIEGAMPTPHGRSPRLCTIWIIRNGEQVPRLVTAYGAARDAG